MPDLFTFVLRGDGLLFSYAACTYGKVVKPTGSTVAYFLSYAGMVFSDSFAVLKTDVGGVVTDLFGILLVLLDTEWFWSAGIRGGVAFAFDCEAGCRNRLAKSVGVFEDLSLAEEPQSWLLLSPAVTLALPLPEMISLKFVSPSLSLPSSEGLSAPVFVSSLGTRARPAIDDGPYVGRATKFLVSAGISGISSGSRSSISPIPAKNCWTVGVPCLKRHSLGALMT